MIARFLAALAFVVIVTMAASKPTQERRQTYYPGYCPGSSWYMVEASDNEVTIGCYDPDYTEPAPDPNP